MQVKLMILGDTAHASGELSGVAAKQFSDETCQSAYSLSPGKAHTQS